MFALPRSCYDQDLATVFTVKIYKDENVDDEYSMDIAQCWLRHISPFITMEQR
jgi:peroxiredoxin